MLLKGETVMEKIRESGSALKNRRFPNVAAFFMFHACPNSILYKSNHVFKAKLNTIISSYKSQYHSVKITKQLLKEKNSFTYENRALYAVTLTDQKTRLQNFLQNDSNNNQYAPCNCLKDFLDQQE